MQTDLSDYSMKNPGDEGYNFIGAEVRYIGELTGIRVQYHPKHGIVSIVPLKEGQVKLFEEARDRFKAELAAATAAIA